MITKIFTSKEVRLLERIVRHYSSSVESNENRKVRESLQKKIKELFSVDQVSVTVKPIDDIS